MNQQVVPDGSVIITPAEVYSKVVALTGGGHEDGRHRRSRRDLAQEPRASTGQGRGRHATWTGDVGTTRSCQVLVGDEVPLPPKGARQVFLRFTDNPEIPVMLAGTVVVR